MTKSLYLLLSVMLIAVMALTACGGGQAGQPEATATMPAGDPAKGQVLFQTSCSACHGPEGQGIPGLGKDLATSEFVAGKSDAELVEFIEQGRPSGDPLNTTGIAMPPKGGNSSLSDQDLQDIVAYIRTLQK